MLKIDGTKIYLTRGDSAWISIPIQTEAGEAYTIAAGDTLALHVRAEPVTGRGTDPIHLRHRRIAVRVHRSEQLPVEQHVHLYRGVTTPNILDITTW